MRKKTEDKKEVYGGLWNIATPELYIEMRMIRGGGYIKKKDGTIIGNGLAFHFKQMQKLLWPSKIWHKWNELLLENFCSHKIIGVLGPASSGKTREASDFMLCDYYCWADCTTVLVSSTEREMLEMRAWGEIKRAHNAAKERYDWLPGQLIESRQRIVTDERSGDKEGRDFRNGLQGCACKKGGSYVGLGCFPSGTMVDTKFGPRPIESIKPGDLVWSATGLNEVRRTSTRISNTLVRVNLSNGQFIDCTPNHPFLTSSGWVPVLDIPAKSVLISRHETLQTMRKYKSRRSAAFLFQKLQRPFLGKNMPVMRNSVCSKRSQEYMLYQILHDEIENEEPGFCEADKIQNKHSGNGKKGKPIRNVKLQRKASALAVHKVSHQGAEDFEAEKWMENKTCLKSEGFWESRKWMPSNSRRNDTPVTISGSAIQFFNYSRSKDSGIEGMALLQARSCLAKHKTVRRSGRGNPLKTKADRKRQKKGFGHAKIRMDNIEILKPAGDSRYNKSEGGYRVYNLEIKGHPSYSVNDIIVHNSYAGVHNKRTSLLADEGGFMPIAYLDAISNLSKAKHFKGIVIGNPKDTTDALGKVCEPSAELGGWDGGIDQTGGTKTWPTRFPGGICVQLVGTDSPNFDGKLGIALINKEQIDSDIAFYGKDSLQYTMMDEARMPRGQASRRIVTRRLCEKGNALEEPVWADEKRVKLGMMDAAYRGVGGDRCTFGGLEFGTGINKEGKHIPMLHLMFSTVVPITGGVKDEPEEQIVNFVKPICEENGISAENLFLDSTGRGSLISAFARLWSPHVKGIEFGSQASADRIVSNEIRELCKDYFFNRVSELWWVIRMIIEAGQFRGLSKEIMDELCMREWTIVGGHKIQVEPKDKTKVRMGRSPDLADMLAVGCEGARQLGFMVTKLASVTYQENEDAWKDELRKRASNLRRVGQLVRV